MDRPLVFRVADLLRRPGSSRDVQVEDVLTDLQGSAAGVPEGVPVSLDVRLDAVNEGIVVIGHVRAPWVGSCRRCLRPVEGAVDTAVTEIFEASPVEGETYLLEVDRIDLEPLAREAVLLGLPLAPLCRDDCPGLCPECGVELAVTGCGHRREPEDDRWAALSELRFEFD